VDFLFLLSFPTRRSSDLRSWFWDRFQRAFFHLFLYPLVHLHNRAPAVFSFVRDLVWPTRPRFGWSSGENHRAAQPSYPRLLSCRSEEHTSELQSRGHLVC